MSDANVEIEVTTTDSTPTVADHRISNKPGHDIALVEIRCTPLVPGVDPTYRAIRVSASPLRNGSHPLTIRRGLVCGLDRCGSRRSLKVVGEMTISDDVTYNEIRDDAPEGLYDQYVNVLTDAGWV